MKNLKDLEIYQLSFQLAVDIYFLSLKLPNSEKYETGSQIRRSVLNPGFLTPSILIPAGMKYAYDLTI